MGEAELQQAVYELAQQWNRPPGQIHHFLQNHQPGAAAVATNTNQLRAQMVRESVAEADERIEKLVKKHKIPAATLTELRGKHTNRLDLIEELTDVAGDLRVQRETDKIRKAEREAASREESVRKVQTARTPRDITGQPVGSRGDDEKGFDEMFEEELTAARRARRA